MAVLEKTLTRKGRVFLKRGGKLRVEYTLPEPQHYVSDGHTLWQYSPADPATLTATAFDDEVIPKEALAFLTGLGRLKKLFRISPSDAFPDAGADHTALQLIPRSKKSPFTAIDALFTPGHVVTTLMLHGRSDNLTTYRFSAIRLNQGIGDDFFAPVVDATRVKPSR